MYTREEQLNIYRRIGITKDVYDVLRKQKRKVKLSMAKLICNLVLKTYGKTLKNKPDAENQKSKPNEATT